MGRSLLKAFLPLLLLFQLSNCQSAVNSPGHQKEILIGPSFAELIHHISKQDVRISDFESRGKHQELEISGLKATVDDDKKEIHFLKNRVALLAASTENATPDEEHNLIKRPVRLLPEVILRGKNRNSSKVSKNVDPRFYGPPTNCSELSMLVYTLNGYYLTRNSSDQGSIGIVYCRFQQLIGKKQNLETFIGNVQLPNKKKTVVRFQVQRVQHLNAPTYIRFVNETFNIGNAFSMKNGTFSAPVAGLYHFQFHGLKNASKGRLKVFFEKNQRLVETTTKTGASPLFSPIFLSTYLRLQPGDEIRVLVHGDGKLYEDENVEHSNTYFSGYLVTEE